MFNTISKETMINYTTTQITESISNSSNELDTATASTTESFT